MRYSLLITAVDNPRAQKIVAHNLAGNRRISLSYAQSLLENVPVEYQTDLTKDDAEDKLRKLTAIGVRGKIVAVDMKTGPVPELRQPEAPAAAQPPQAPQEKIAASSRGGIFLFKENTVPVVPAHDGAMKKRLLIAGVLAILVLTAGILVVGAKKWRFNLNAQGVALFTADTAAQRQRDALRAFSAGRGGPKPASSGDNLRSEAYADSGKLCADPAGAVAFYKLAIGINKHNVNAWYGLLATYTALGSEGEAQKTRDQMKAIFGEEIFSLQKTVEQFGTLLDAYTTADGTVHIEYRSRESDAHELIHETFLLARAIGTNRNAAAFSLYAHASQSRAGVLVYAPADLIAQTYPEYRTTAKITELH